MIKHAAEWRNNRWVPACAKKIPSIYMVAHFRVLVTCKKCKQTGAYKGLEP